jgi:monoamine oxidase
LLPSKGAPLRQRTAINDTRGHISELLAKAINKGALDQEMSAEEKKRLLPFLKAYGDLADDMTFKGTERSGLKVTHGTADQIAEGFAPVPLQKLLENEQLPLSLFEDNIMMQATMFQPVGGMDQLPMGFQRAIKSPILRQAEVISIRQDTHGVSVAIKDFKTRKSSAVKADYAIVTLPFTVLSKIDNNFDKPVKQAIGGLHFDHASKVAFESPRFWERDQIYGGISFVGGETGLVWYPSWGLHTDKGVLVACYAIGGQKFATRPLAEQIAMSSAVVERLHPGKADQMGKPIAVNWSKIPYNYGAWANWNPEAGGREMPNTKPGYTLLNQPHGRVHFCGAHLSQMPGWQEGAVLSAHRTINTLVSQAGAKAAPAKG